MAYEQQEIVARLAEALTNSGCQQQELGAAAGLDKTQISRLLKGERNVSAAELGAMADFLGVSATELLTGRAPVRRGSRPLALAARLAEAKRSDELTEQVERFRSLLEVKAQVERDVVAPARPARPNFDLPTTTYRKVQGAQAAHRLREALSLGDEPIEDVSGLIEAYFHADVAREPMPASVVGLLLQDQESEDDDPVAVMLVNSYYPYGKQRFTAAHELAHLLFGDVAEYHEDAAYGERSLVELRADAFAAELLTPTSGVKVVAKEIGDAPDTPPAHRQWAARLVGTVASRFGVSVETARYRCADLGLVSDVDEATLAATSAADVLRAAASDERALALEEERDVIDPPALLTSQALYAYSEGLVGIGTLAQLWRTDDADGLRKELAEAGWVPAFE